MYYIKYTKYNVQCTLDFFAKNKISCINKNETEYLLKFVNIKKTFVQKFKKIICPTTKSMPRKVYSSRDILSSVPTTNNIPISYILIHRDCGQRTIAATIFSPELMFQAIRQFTIGLSFGTKDNASSISVLTVSKFSPPEPCRANQFACAIPKILQCELSRYPLNQNFESRIM